MPVEHQEEHVRPDLGRRHEHEPLIGERVRDVEQEGRVFAGTRTAGGGSTLIHQLITLPGITSSPLFYPVATRSPGCSSPLLSTGPTSIERTVTDRPSS